MMLRATAKLQALLRPPHLSAADPTSEDWYGNLLWLDGRKCVLLTHADTLFSIFAPDVRAAQLRPVGPWLTMLIHDHLAAEQLPQDALGSLTVDEVRVGQTASRHVLGVMNDMAFGIEYAIAHAGALNACDIADLNHQLRRGLHRHDGHYVRPLDLAAARTT